MSAIIRSKRSPGLVQSTPQLIELLPGEITIAQASKAQQILHFTTKLGYPFFTVNGTLLCTNYRVCFVPDPSSPKKKANIHVPELESCSLEASRNIPLGCIREFSVMSSKTKKLVDGRATLPKKFSEIEVVCRDLRRFVFSIKHSHKSEASTLVNAIARHTHPSSVQLLFAFDYTRALLNSRREESLVGGVQDTPIPSYLNPRDWQRELTRLGVTNDQWKITEVNKKFLICNSLCPYFVCPTNYSDSAYDNIVGLHCHNRVPVWCWSHPVTGVSLTRAGTTTVEDQSEAPDPNYLRAVAMARHKDFLVEKKRVNQCDLSLKCGSIKDVSAAFAQMMELAIPGSLAELAASDRRWYGALDSSGWLELVRSCLQSAKEVALLICVRRRCVMIHEETGRDFTSVVSSLFQLMVDPHCRSISGFEALVQKEWVAMGHPFAARHALVLDPHKFGSEGELTEAPVFLLFLDCVWQLSRQFPSAFEYSESYLLHLYDMVNSCLYSNFVFDSSKQRFQASLYSRRSCFFGNDDETMDQVDNYEGPLISAWGRWRESLSKEENELCLNPFYYIFGSGDAHFDYGSPGNVQKDRISTVVSDAAPNLSAISNFGLYTGSPESSPTHNDIDPMTDFYKQGLLLPETSLCSMKFWGGFYSRFIPDLSDVEKKHRLRLHKLESRLVKDVRKIKDDLNELELSCGTYTSDLNTFIGEVLQEREREMEHTVELSMEAGLLQAPPRHSAMLYAFDDVESSNGVIRMVGDREMSVSSAELPSSPIKVDADHTPTPTSPMKADSGEGNQQQGHVRTHSAAGKKSSLAQFTDALYSSEREDSITGSIVRPKQLAERSFSISGDHAAGRSPVIKTRLRVVKSKPSDPVVAAWQNSPREQTRPMEKILIKARKDSVESMDSLNGHMDVSISSEITEL